MSYGSRRVPYAIKRYVAQALDKAVEDKYILWSLPSTFGTIQNTWVEVNLTSIAQGDTVITRTGNAVRIKSLEIDGVLIGGNNYDLSDDGHNVLRMVLGTYDAESFTPLATGNANISTCITKKNAFQTLGHKFIDKYFTFQAVSNGAAAGYAPQLKPFKYYKRFSGSGILITYGDTSGGHADRNLIMSMISDSSTGTNPHFLVGYMKLVFEDA